MKVVRVQHDNKTSFQTWWEGKANLRKSSGIRWLVITFPWDMGEPNLVDVGLETEGHLFSLPTPASPRDSMPCIAKTHPRKLSAKDRMNDMEATKDQEDVEVNNMKNRDDGEISNEKSVVDAGNERAEIAENLSKEEHHIDVLSHHSIHRLEIQTSRGNPAFDVYREVPSDSSDDSSQGIDHDLI